jgi:hypothetical protein
MARCKDDSCDLNHCTICGCHILRSGICDLCWESEVEKENVKKDESRKPTWYEIERQKHL